MIVCTKIAAKNFVGDSMKSAFLNANKWIGSNILANEKLSANVNWSMQKIVSDSGLPSVEVTFYVRLEESEMHKRFCERCKEFHCLFYINQQQNCNNCNMSAYRAQMAERLRALRSFGKSICEDL